MKLLFDNNPFLSGDTVSISSPKWQEYHTDSILFSHLGGLPQKGLIDNVDVDTLTSQGSYYLRNNITNAPDWSYLIVIQVLNKENIIQINMLANGTLVKIRARASSGWGTWRDLLAQM